MFVHVILCICKCMFRINCNQYYFWGNRWRKIIYNFDMYFPIALHKGCTNLYLCKKYMRICFPSLASRVLQLRYLPIWAIYSWCNFNLYFSHNGFIFHISVFVLFCFGIKCKVRMQLNFFPDDIPPLSTELLNSSSFSAILQCHLYHRLNSWK